MEQARGSILPLVAVLTLSVGVCAVWLGRLGGAAADRARARTAADAAALAGAAEGEEAAREVAAANGATLVRFERDGTDVEVRVELGTSSAKARARREPELSPVCRAVAGRSGLRWAGCPDP